MNQSNHSKIVSFIWGIADDVLRDLFKRGKYPDVILPMCVLRRMDAVLEPTKQAVLDTKKMLDDAGITEQRAALCAASGQAFFNTSRFTLRDLKSRGSRQQLLADFEDYLNGFSPNVQDILDNFKFRNQLPTLSKADALGTLINMFLDPEIDLSPAGMDNHAMGTVFEELVRRFNEENNEEAGEHWTPRDAVRLMANLVFLPIADQLKSGTYLLYDGACGTGGMLTVAEDTLKEIANKNELQISAAKDFFNGARSQVGHRAPAIIVTDGCGAYRKGVSKNFWGKVQLGECKLIQKQGLRARIGKLSNNLIERFHNTLKDRTKIVRGFGSKKGAFNALSGFVIQYNYLRPHMALHGDTPAITAGIRLPIENGWGDLIQWAMN